MKERHQALVAEGNDWQLRSLESASMPHSVVDGQKVIMLCSNNYLDLARHPAIVEAMATTTRELGAGSGSVRAIAGNMTIHEEVERAVAQFKGVEASLVFQTGFSVGSGFVPTLVGKEDAVISDALNHGCMIDGIRLTKADRRVYAHNDIHELEAHLRDTKQARRRLVLTDGVFSMDGDIAPLDAICELCEQFDAMLYVDDAHGEGVMGKGGRGIVDHFGLQGRVDFEAGTFSKAFGVVGGLVAGAEEVRLHALNNSRTWLLSASHPPGVAAAQKAAIDVLENEPEHHARLWSVTNRIRNALQDLGFDTGDSVTPIIPIMCGESDRAKAFSEGLYKRGVLALPIVFPMVPREKARVRCMMNAGLSDDDVDEVIRIMEETGRDVGLI